MTRAVCLSGLCALVTASLQGQQLQDFIGNKDIKSGEISIDTTNAPKSAGKQSTSAKPPLRVLFIGNSLTFNNNTPGLFRSIAAAGLHRQIITGLAALGGGTFEQFWSWDKLHDVIKNNQWDFIVLQAAAPLPNPGQPLDTTGIYPYVQKFSQEATEAHAQLVGYPPYPILLLSPDVRDKIDSVVATLASRGGKFAPVASAWRAVQHTEPTLNLYDDDQVHPSMEGSYLVALALYRTITQQSPLGSPHPKKISDHNAEILQKAVATAQ